MPDVMLLLICVAVSCGIVLLAMALVVIEPKPPYSRWYEQ